MIGQMDRAAIKALHRKGVDISEIARQLVVDRKTVRRALKEPMDKVFSTPERASQVDVYEEQIREWLKRKIPVGRMLEMARANESHPYEGGKSAFYERVRKIRKKVKLSQIEAAMRFEGLPGEYLQVDWGERLIGFTGQEAAKRYFLCCRLKYSRFMYVEVHENMELETVIRGLARCFIAVAGIPWQCVFDNMKTVTVGRDDKNQPVFNERFFKFASECDFSPFVCTPGAGNQKGSVENLVGFLKSSFLPGRTFHDDADLRRELAMWLSDVNDSPCQAHGQKPIQLLPEEQVKMTPLMPSVTDYGILHWLGVSPESCVRLDTNTYSVPSDYIGQTLAVRVHAKSIRVYDDDNLVAEHSRCFEKRQRLVVPEHFEEVFKVRPRARVMVYRDILVKMGEDVSDYISELCRRRRDNFGPDILALYRQREVHGEEEFRAATSLALEQRLFGAEYVEALLRFPESVPVIPVLVLDDVPVQAEIDRNLRSYERFVEGGYVS